jgi:hypothetical protein
MDKQAQEPVGAMRIMSIDRLFEELEKKPKSPPNKLATVREYVLGTVRASPACLIRHERFPT